MTRPSPPACSPALRPGLKQLDRKAGGSSSPEGFSAWASGVSLVRAVPPQAVSYEQPWPWPQGWPPCLSGSFVPDSGCGLSAGRGSPFWRWPLCLRCEVSCQMAASQAPLASAWTQASGHQQGGAVACGQEWAAVS